MKPPKEEAEELFNSHKENITYYGQAWKDLNEDAKIHAQLTVDKIIQTIPHIPGTLDAKWEYWQEVKNELNKML